MWNTFSAKTHYIYGSEHQGLSNMTQEIAVAEDAPAKGPMQWELADQAKLAWRALKWAFTAMISLMFLVVIGQGFLFYRVFADVHPALGIGFIAILALVLFLLVGRPLMSFFTTPVVARPSTATLDFNNPSQAVMSDRLKYDVKYLSSMRRNPDLTAERPAVDKSIAEAKRLLARVNSAKTDELKDLANAIAVFEVEQIEARLADIDARVDKLIHAEAVGVGVATAISMNGTVDAFIVLWRNANLVSRISRMYFGRPHLRGSLIILRDVAGIVVLARALEDVTEITGEVIGSLLGRMGGLVAGPVMDGAINAMMTLKLGYLAKRRCRSFQSWTPEQASSISADALARVKKESSSVASDLLKRCGGLTATAARATEKAMTGSKNAWSTIQSWFGGPAKA
jgi:uncharacterized membrane protein YcjF (UPF0283 family)